jgi:hypothetical protein
MKVRHAVLAGLAAAVTLAAVATASPESAKQRVQITTGGGADFGSVQKFVLFPLSAGPLEPDSGTVTGPGPANQRTVTRDGQPAQIVTWVSTQKGKHGSFVVRARIEHIDAGNGFHIGTGTWKFVRGTGAYAGITGGGRVANAFIDFGSRALSERWDGFLTVP